MRFRLLASLTGLALFSACSSAPVQRHPDVHLMGLDRPWFEELKKLKASELEAIFAAGQVNGIPLGAARGYAIIDDRPGIANRFASTVWGGKTFHRSEDGDPGRAWLENKIFFGEIIRAEVYIGDTRRVLGLRGQRRGPVASNLFDIEQASFDGRPSIILDYSATTLPPVRGIRDEIRQIWPDRYKNLYLGRAWNEGALWVYFVLKFPD